MLKNLNISYEELVEIAFETGFIKRKRLIDLLGFLSAVCIEATIGIASYNDIAAHMDADNGASVSRQAIWKKVKGPVRSFKKKYWLS